MRTPLHRCLVKIVVVKSESMEKDSRWKDRKVAETGKLINQDPALRAWKKIVEVKKDVRKAALA